MSCPPASIHSRTMVFTESDCFRLKLLRILETAGEEVLRYTLLCGTDSKPPNVPIDDYLKNLPPSSTANFNNMIQEHVRKKPRSSGDMPSVYKKAIKSQFNDTDLRQIRSDPSCATFDITLLHKAIKLACEDVPGISDQMWKTPSSEMEYLVTKIKELRNEVIHEKKPMTEHEYLSKVVELQILFSSALEATKRKYTRNDSEFTAKKDEVMEAVEAIKAEHVGTEEILQRSASRLLPIFQHEADRELKDRLDSCKYLNPLHFLSGHEDRTVDVHDIFSKIVINDEYDKKTQIHYLRLLSLIHDTRSLSSPHVMLVEGEAGSGKTTLLTFLLAEWLKDESYRQMEGFQHIDLLLWVVCREDTSHNLEELVKRALPDASVKWGNFLLPLLKKCRVLTIIDGLDEQNNVSRGLVTDIMNQGKDCPTFTVICTSRPEGVRAMKARKPQNFMISHVIIVGLSIEERTDFAVSYFRFLSSGGSTNEDVDRLRQVMQQIGWKEIFRLPLNVLFLATIYYFDPRKLKTILTQTELYQYINDWCVQKLLDRLARHPDVTYTISLPQRVNSILSLFHEVALKGLLRDSIYLSEEDQQHLMKSCSNEKLPEGELLSAFYCLRRDVIHGVPTERFGAPHKGLQEFFAAHHVLGCLDNYKQGDIRRVLQNYSPRQDLRLEPLRNLLSHLLGQMSLQDVPKVKAMEESIELLVASGVRTTDSWLRTLADTAAHPYTMARVADHIKSLRVDDNDDTDSGEDHYDDTDSGEEDDEDTDNDEDNDDTDSGEDNYDDIEEVEVTEGTVHVAASLLPLIPRKAITLEFNVDPVGMGLLAPALVHHTVDVLYLLHHYKHPEASSASAHLLQQVPRSHLARFMGHVEDLQCLQEGRLERLYLAVNNNHMAITVLAQLEHVRGNFPQLRHLRIHVPVSQVTPASLKQLPDDRIIHVILVLSSVSEGNLSEACGIAATMCPRKRGYWWIMFPGASLGVAGYTQLLEAMKGSGVKVRGAFGVQDTAITKDEESQLNTLAKSLLRCRLRRVPEELLWRWE